MKLLSPTSEMRAIYSVCEADQIIQHTLLAGINDHTFYSETAREAYQRIKKQLESRSSIPSYTDLCDDPVLTDDVKEDIRDALKRAKKSRVKTKAEAHNLLKGLNEFAKHRILLKTAEAVLNDYQNDKAPDPESVADLFLKASADSKSQRLKTRELIEFGGKGSYEDLIHDILDGDKPDIVPTGLNGFDDINGGFYLGSLVVLAATSGGGKSLVANAMALNMARFGYDSVMVPLEMTEKETMGRTIANLAQVPVTDVLNQRLTKAQKKKVKKATNKFHKILKDKGSRYTIWEPEEDVTMDEILSYLLPYGHQVVFIDYISLLKGVDGDDSWQQLGKVARTGKVWAKQNNKILVILAQLGKDGDLRYSKAIAEHANNMFAWMVTDEDRDTGILDIRQPKARNHDPAPFSQGVDWATMSVHAVDEDRLNEMESKAGNKKRKKLKAGTDDLEALLKGDDDD